MKMNKGEMKYQVWTNGSLTLATANPRKAIEVYNVYNKSKKLKVEIKYCEEGL